MEGVIDVVLDVKSSFRITRWKVKAGTKISKGCLLGLYETSAEKQALKLKADKNHVGTVIEVLVKEKDLVDAGSVVLKIEKCKHPTIMKDMCAECGADLKKIRIETDFKNSKQESFSSTPSARNTASVAMVHSIPELRVSKEEAESLGRADQKRLLLSRKLVLMVDLDQTLIHTTNENIDPKIDDVLHFQLWHHGPHAPWYHTKIRPHTKLFLDNINQLFELHIVTFGSRMYAHTVAKFIDPQGKYFSHRILSRDECFDSSSKTANLKDLFPCGDSMVAIIDDREDVWNSVPNLIPVRAYSFFQGTGDINAPSGAGRSSIPAALTKAFVTGGSEEDIVDVLGNVEKTSKEGEDTTKETIERAEPEESANSIDSQSNFDGKEEKSAVRKEEVATVKEEAEKQKAESQSAETKDPVSEVNSGLCSQETESSDETKETEEKLRRDDEKTPILECDGLWLESEDKDEDKGVTAERDREREPSLGGNGSPKDETIIKNDDASDVHDDASDKKDKIVIEDHDDYLIYLEDVLKRIHAAFYELYDQKNREKSKRNNDDDDSDDDANVEGKEKTAEQLEEGKVPDLKHVMPYVRKKILKGVNVLFSGVIPRNVILERHKIFRTALALGAKVHKNLVTSGEEKTTHVVAARLGTEKVLHAQRKGVHVVIPHWLWSCSERWERVDERVFELTKETEIQLDDVRARSGRSSPTVLPPQTTEDPKRPKRKVNAREEKQEGLTVDIYDPKTGTKLNYRPGKRTKLEGGEDDLSNVNRMEFDDVFDDDNDDVEDCNNDDGVDDESKGRKKKGKKGKKEVDDADLGFAESLNPFMRFSQGDIDNMDKEVADMVSSDEDDDNDSEKEEAKIRELVLHGSPGGSSGGGSSPGGHGSRDSDSDDSLSGDYPRGWGIPKRKQSSPRDPTDVDDFDENVEGAENTRDTDIMREEDVLSDDDNDDDEYQGSTGSVDEDMAAALEQEFLGKQFMAYSSKDEIGKND